MNNREIRDKLEDGYIQARAVLQMVGKPKEHLEKTLHEFVKNIKEMTDAGFTIYEENYAEAELHPDGEKLYSTYCEVELLAKDLDGLMNFCFEGMPASVEVMEPENIVMTANDATRTMNELAHKLHQTDMIAKEANQSHKLMAQSMNILVQNCIGILLHLGPRSIDEIAKSVGIDEKSASAFVKTLIDDKKIIEKDGKYSLAPKV